MEGHHWRPWVPLADAEVRAWESGRSQGRAVPWQVTGEPLLQVSDRWQAAGPGPSVLGLAPSHSSRGRPLIPCGV